ncbi:hypothetical protein BDZ90DRAFT_261473 [Jaminaea rosea]|uniref:Uncharacterized protein n=1 Tax=Jaminaea rosea TaxID=1569628 RepID=A0A316ULH3_9BASI|nr:hypothetical protein BDZ90DRAFT_261473 [Jaminaea rosea]PWN26142.1 hypothetical protein BDZ90DRAFT_261473 [Jaminaea rosea]
MSPPTHIAAPLSLPNQEILQPPPPSHHLSASDDLITRFHLHDSYRILLHPFRKDLHHQPRDTTVPTTKAEAGPSTPTRPTSGEATGGPSDTRQQHQQSYTLPKTFAHYLPPSLPGKVRPPKPPRKNQILARRAAAQALEGGGQQLGGGGEQQGGGPDSSASGSSAERKLARQHAEWEKASSTLRRVVYKAEYSGPSEMRTWGEGEEGMRGFLGLEAGDVDEIDRSLLEADAPTGSTPPRKKKRKGQHGNQQQQQQLKAGQTS